MAAWWALIDNASCRLLINGVQFMKDTFLDAAEQIFCFKSDRDVFVRRTVITMIPILAAYDTQTFSEHFLHKAMGHLLTVRAERSFGTNLGNH
jgi:hypothetical protein